MCAVYLLLFKPALIFSLIGSGPGSRPMKKKKPVIGITTDIKDEHFVIEEKYAHAVIKAGGIPLLIPSVTGNPELSGGTMAALGGLLLPGSRDMDPKFYNEEPHPKLMPMSLERTETEFSVLNHAIEREIPVLGICGGMQLINVYYGGSLFQDICEFPPDALPHEKGSAHDIEVKEGTVLHEITGKKNFPVKSYHHQSVKEVGEGLRVNAVTSDGIIEGIESESASFVLGVQWHPELEDTEISEAIFYKFIEESGEKRD